MTAKGSLYLLPEPNLDEMPSSWLIRVAQLHGVSVKELLAGIGVTRSRDLDIAFASRAIGRLTRGVDLNVGRLHLISRIFGPFRNERWMKVWLRKDTRQQLTTGFCPNCLSEDYEPYWRSVWRFRYWVACPTHRRRLLDACAGCSRLIQIDRYINRPATPSAESFLTVCVHCGESLMFGGSQDEPLSPVLATMAIDLQRVVTAALFHNGFQVVGIPEKVPVSFLPSVLIAGALPGESMECDPDPRLIDEIRSAISYASRSGARGIRRKSEIYVAQSSSYRVWKGDVAKLAEKVIELRFLKLLDSSVDLREAVFDNSK